MNLLAIDTSSNACSVALRYDDEVTEKHVVEPREHTRLLMPMITGILDGRTVQTLDAIVIGNGPGSFIGMRIGASVAQGIAHAAGLEIIPVSSLAAIAAEVLAAEKDGGVVVAQDARMSQVYLGVYRRIGGGEIVRNGDETLHQLGPLSLAADGWLAAGSAWERYPELLAANSHVISGVTGVVYPRARFLLQLADAGDAVPPAQLVPAYLRSKVAEKPAKPS
jgi:tRNA threonylcarbamoyladenosine biosynthesis protein TsaB